MIVWLPYIWDPPDPAQADVGEPPSAWCDKNCPCGQPCGELDRHRGACRCLAH